MRDVKKYVCTFCERQFTKSYHLCELTLQNVPKSHVRMHTVERSFSCTVCGKAFWRKDHLRDHNDAKSGSRKRKRVSKKNKSSWRKHSDIRDIEGFLEDQRREERTGGAVHLKKNEELFFVDKPSQPIEIKNASNDSDTGRSRKDRPLRCHSALLPDPRIKPARESHNIRTASTASKKQCVQKKEKLAAGVLSKKEQRILKQRADAREQLKQRKQSTIRSRAVVKYDLWGDEPDKPSPAVVDEHYQSVCKLRRVQPPAHYHKKPSLVKAIEIAPPGASYNPTDDDHQELLYQALKVEIVRTKAEERVTRSMDEKFPVVGEAPDEMTWLKEMSGGLGIDDEDEAVPQFTAEDLDRLSNNPPVRREDKKSEKVRRNMKENQLKAKLIAKEKERNAKNQEMFKLKSIKRDMKRREFQLAARAARQALVREAHQNDTKKLGKLKYDEPTVAFKLGHEVEGSLRLLKPEGHILEDRFKSLQKRNIIEPRLRAKRIRKYKPKEFDKKGHRSVAE